jgi:hypothetical protein
MSNRRQSFVPAAEAYKIYTEIVGVGKTVADSKRKIKWMFGISDDNTEYEVIMVHSLTSGKKVCRRSQY